MLALWITAILQDSTRLKVKFSFQEKTLFDCADPALVRVRTRMCTYFLLFRKLESLAQYRSHDKPRTRCSRRNVRSRLGLKMFRAYFKRVKTVGLDGDNDQATRIV